MFIRYWQPSQEMDLMRRQLDRLFSDLMPVEQASDSSRKSVSQPTWRPAIELYETQTAIVLRAQLPGVDAKNLNVEVTQDIVSITGHRPQPSTAKGNPQSEFCYGSFHRVVPLSTAVQNDQVEAQYEAGILTLTLPKVEAVRHKVVKVNLTDSNPEVAAEPTDPWDA